MGYKVNRIGTPYLMEIKNRVVRSIDVGSLDAWGSDNTSFEPSVMFPSASSVSQFDMTRYSFTGVQNWTAGRSVRIGQLFNFGEVVNGNACLVEPVATFSGAVPDTVEISHMVGPIPVGNLPSGPFGVAVCDQPIPISVLPRPYLGADAVRVRSFCSRDVVMWQSSVFRLSSEIGVHFIELKDTSQSGAEHAGVGEFSVSLGFRSIYNLDRLQPFDPVR